MAGVAAVSHFVEGRGVATQAFPSSRGDFRRPVFPGRSYRPVAQAEIRIGAWPPSRGR
jgi:hypothetical protein